MSGNYDVDHELKAAVEQALQALQNVPQVGEVYDQQHSDTHLRAQLRLEQAVKQTDVF